MIAAMVVLTPSFGEDRMQRQSDFYYNSLESSHVPDLMRWRFFLMLVLSFA